MDTVQLSRAADLRPGLSLEKKDKGNKTRKLTMRKVIINMTVNNHEMPTLFSDVVALMDLDDLELKRMCYLFLETYAKQSATISARALAILRKDCKNSESPYLRSLALRAMSSVVTEPYIIATIETSRLLCMDEDAYVRKTAVYALCKAWSVEPSRAEKAGIFQLLNQLLDDPNYMVLGAAIACLHDISEHFPELKLVINAKRAQQLLSVLPSCNEWSQVYILTSLCSYVPQESDVAVAILERSTPLLQHSNSAVAVAAIRLLVYLINYIDDVTIKIPDLSRSLENPIKHLLSKPHEIQLIILKNCILLLQGRQGLLQLDKQLFYTKHNDPSYIKTAKIELLGILADSKHTESILEELLNCAADVDLDAARKAIQTVGSIALKSPSECSMCANWLVDLCASQTPYILQEAMVALVSIIRRYSSKQDQQREIVNSILPLTENYEQLLHNPESKKALIWFTGEYFVQFSLAGEILQELIDQFEDEDYECKSLLLTACAKAYSRSPHPSAYRCFDQCLQLSLAATDDVDLRNKAVMYHRLYQIDHEILKDVCNVGRLPIDLKSSLISDDNIDELLRTLGYLSSVYLKPAVHLFRAARRHELQASPALATKGVFRPLRQ